MITLLLQYLENASHSEKYLIEYIINNLELVAKQDITELSENANVSMATTSRFTKKLGFASFKEFIYSIKLELENANQQTLNEDDGLILVLNKGFEDILRLNNKETYENIAKLIFEADYINVFAKGKSRIARDYFVSQFLPIGKHIYTPNDKHDVTTLAIHSGARSVNIFISNKGSTREYEDLARLTSQLNSKNILITANPSSEIGRYCTQVLNTGYSEGIWEDVRLSMASCTLQMFLISNLISIYHEKYAREIERNNMLFKELFKD